MAKSEAVYKTKYAGRESFKAPIGSKIQLRHEATIDDATGRRILTKTRKVNFYDEIQVGREETEIERIVARAKNGDASVLNAMNGQYIDVTDMPTNLAEAHRFMQNAETMFQKMPNEVKSKFGYDVDRFIHEAGTDVNGWLKKMGLEADEKGKVDKIKPDLSDLNSGVEITRQSVEVQEGE